MKSSLFKNFNVLQTSGLEQGQEVGTCEDSNEC
jgi:hypothetical protein